MSDDPYVWKTKEEAIEGLRKMLDLQSLKVTLQGGGIEDLQQMEWAGLVIVSRTCVEDLIKLLKQ